VFALTFHLPWLAPMPSPSGSPNPATDSVWQSPEVVAAYIIGTITVAGFLIGFLTLRFQRRLERERAEFEDKLARERVRWESAHQQNAVAESEKKAEEESRRRLARAVGDRERGAEIYKQSLVRELGALKVLDMAKPLDLNALYVQVKIREDESRRYVADEEIEALATGQPAALLAATAERTVAKHAEAVQPEDALIQFQHVVVLGDPGAGKTTMLKHLAFRICRGELDGLTGVPIFVELRRFIDSGMDDILAFAVKDCDDRYDFADAGAYVHERLRDGTAALLFDGLDEVLGGADASQANDAYRKASGEISRLCARYPKAPIAVTCRRAGFNGGLDRFQVLEVLDFTWEQSRRFLENWFRGRESEYRDLVNSLNRNVRMKTLAANPLILSLIAIVYENDLELPERRAELYNRCVEVLLKEWDSKRGIRRYSQFTTDRKRDLLEELAWHFHVQGKRYFPEPEVLAMIRDFLPTIGLDEADPAAVLKEIAANYGLLKEQATGWYGFWHLTVQEYFAAVWASEHYTESRDFLLRHRHDPWWEEVILLLAGRMSDATDLLLGIAGIIDHQAELSVPIVVDDDILHRDLLLMGDCLLAAPRIRKPGLRAAIMESLWTVLTESEDTYSIEQAARILVVLGEQKYLNRLRASLTSWRPLAYFGTPRLVGVALAGYGDEAYVTPMVEDLPKGDFRFDLAVDMLLMMRERGFATTGAAFEATISSVDLSKWESSAGSEKVKEFMIALCDVDAELANRTAVRLIPAIRDAAEQRDGMGKYYAMYLGAACAYIAARRNDPDLLSVVRDQWSFQEYILGSGEYVPALLKLSQPGTEEEVMREFIDSELMVWEEIGPKALPYYSDPLMDVAVRSLRTVASNKRLKVYEFLDIGSPRPEKVRQELDRTDSDLVEVRVLYLALLIRVGESEAIREAKDNLREWLTGRQVDLDAKRFLIKAMLDGGHADLVLAEVVLLFAGMHQDDKYCVAELSSLLNLVPSVHRDAVADSLWETFERFYEVLRTADPEGFFRAFRAVMCSANLKRIISFKDVREIFSGEYPAPSAESLMPYVDSTTIVDFVRLCQELDGARHRKGLTGALIENNYRLYPDGRLVPAAPQGLDSRWTSTS
jgi:hypothetical protein